MNVISVRISDDEKKLLEKYSNIYNCGISTLLKKITFEKLSDDFDLNIIKKYEQDKKNKTLELIDIQDVWKELDL